MITEIKSIIKLISLYLVFFVLKYTFNGEKFKWIMLNIFDIFVSVETNTNKWQQSCKYKDGLLRSIISVNFSRSLRVNNCILLYLNFPGSILFRSSASI